MPNEIENQDTPADTFVDYSELASLVKNSQSESTIHPPSEVLDLKQDEHEINPDTGALKYGKFSQNPLMQEAFSSLLKTNDLEWLKDRIDHAESPAALLDLLEVITSDAVYLRKGVYKETRQKENSDLISEVMQKLFTSAEQGLITPADVALGIQIRSFLRATDTKGGDRPSYVPHHDNDERIVGSAGLFKGHWAGVTSNEALDGAYHTAYQSALSRRMRDFAQSKYIGVNGKAREDILHGDEFSREGISMASIIYLHYRELREGIQEQSISDLVKTDVRNEFSLENSIHILEEVTMETLPTRSGSRYIGDSLRMFQGMMSDLDRGRIGNAVQIYTLLKSRTQRTGGVAPLAIKDVIDVANGLRSQLKQPPIPSQGSDLENQYPLAIDTIVDVSLNYGSNTLTPDQRQRYEVYSKVMSDLFVIGKYLKDEHYKDGSIADYLDAHPTMSAKRLEKVLNPEPDVNRPNDENYKDLRRQFGSVVYWRASKPGYGIVS